MTKPGIISILFIAFFHTFFATAQEHKGPLQVNTALFEAAKTPKPLKRTTALTLPFFDDFTIYDVYPDAGKWTDRQVYINNTMAIDPVSRGVATFDALNELGLPRYNDNSVFRKADSLTSQPIDLSGYRPADSLYLSFFYQPQGYGYFPLPQDSLMLYMRITYGDWIKVWSVPGGRVRAFQQVMIPITDTLYYYNSFQFMFVNIAAMNYADAIWNLDYVRLDARRNYLDTAVNDIAINKDPGFLLNDYTSMPYRQFMANPSGERAAIILDSVRNNTTASQPVTYGFTAWEPASGTVLQSRVTNTTTINPQSKTAIRNNTYTTTVPLTGSYEKVVYNHQHYIESTTSTGPSENDTILKRQVFDNYLAYDDGSAEQSYYLSLFPTLPGKIAIEHHLNVPDTLRGMAIYFGRTAPLSVNKTFDIVIYSSLQGINGAVADNVLYRQASCDPGYADTINHFWVYKFDTPVPLSAGTFYAGVFMPAESGSDSLYFGLDINRIGGNHAYYNVLSAWAPSLINGAIMMRPLLGGQITASAVNDVLQPPAKTWSIGPNPASGKIKVNFDGDCKMVCSIVNLNGTLIMKQPLCNGETLDITPFPAGAYIVYLGNETTTLTPIKLIKQ